MRFKKCCVSTCMFFLICAPMAVPETGISANLARLKVDPQTAPRIEFIRAEELKAQIAKNRPLTIIDVRSTNGSGGGIQARPRLKRRLGGVAEGEWPSGLCCERNMSFSIQ